MNWRKVPEYKKWAGYANGKHIATITQTGPDIKAWCDAGQGWQRVHPLDEQWVAEHSDLSTRAHLTAWKRFVEMAFESLMLMGVK